MRKVKILWADDEIQMLKPHILFLEEKGYSLETAASGDEAIEIIQEDYFDLVFLDENMPGLSGLEALSKIKKIKPNLPIVMITKSEEEHIMEEAIGSEIDGYLIKPVNPHQILLTIKQTIDEKKLIAQQTTSSYQREFREIGMRISDGLDFDEWKEVYKELVHHELAIDRSENSGMEEVLEMQKTEANNEFSKFIEQEYESWFEPNSEKPILSHNIMEKKVIPELSNEPVFFILLDCLRFDQWKVLQRKIAELYKVTEDIVYSILPTATQFCRNALFAGMLPNEIRKRYSDKWVEEYEEDGKNMHEAFFLEECLKRYGKSDAKLSYNKVTNLHNGQKLEGKINELFDNDLNVIVYNFVDALSHARTDFKIVRELANDESAYRSITSSWFEHSTLWSIMKKIAATGGKIVLTTDHGSTIVNQPIKVLGDKMISSNLRYKQGKNMQYKSKDVFEINDPEKVGLPKLNVSSNYIFARNNDFFAYPNNYNHYVKHYKNTFQHGGISMEEMMIPFIVLEKK